MNNDKYLEYVRTLHNRVSNRNKNDGFTVWALIVGIIYLTWNSIPLLNIIKNDSNSLNAFFICYSHIHILILFSILIFTYSSSSPITAFDYRIHKNSFTLDFKGLIDILITLFLILLLPIYTIHFISYPNVILSNYHIYQLALNKWFFIVTSILFLITGISLGIYQKSKGYPFPLTLPTKKFILFLECIKLIIMGIYNYDYF
ncbi:MAG: hypothetical protein ACUBOA_12475 [Candidatus Loosdrechtia sp.]|uniref:hypothetical protein n=1 Tax=Candidatus Loosdrechtia sp. TaxID=3101272 RepID=UPI003A74BBA2|nr:MAG: hypothetical protein QY305_01930 [Candidatus Jettenia sp. AMX2]